MALFKAYLDLNGSYAWKGDNVYPLELENDSFVTRARVNAVGESQDEPHPDAMSSSMQPDLVGPDCVEEDIAHLFGDFVDEDLPAAPATPVIADAPLPPAGNEGLGVALPGD